MTGNQQQLSYTPSGQIANGTVVMLPHLSDTKVTYSLCAILCSCLAEVPSRCDTLDSPRCYLYACRSILPRRGSSARHALRPPRTDFSLVMFGRPYSSLIVMTIHSGGANASIWYAIQAKSACPRPVLHAKCCDMLSSQWAYRYTRVTTRHDVRAKTCKHHNSKTSKQRHFCVL